MFLREDLNYYFYFNSYHCGNDFLDMGYAKKTSTQKTIWLCYRQAFCLMIKSVSLCCHSLVAVIAFPTCVQSVISPVFVQSPHVYSMSR